MTIDHNRPRTDDSSATSTEEAPISAAEPGLQVEPVLTATHQPQAKKSVIREYAEAIVVAMLLAFAIRVFVVQAFKIPSGSMIPTLLIGDHILVSKLSYGLQWPTNCKFHMSFPPITCYSAVPLVQFGKPERGDIIVFRFPEDEEKDFIKRIVGLPGDAIQIRNKVVSVNGTSLSDSSYTQRIDPGLIDGMVNPRDNFGPVTVPEDSYFVMGDNRDQSLDSRFWGYVREEKIRGKAFRIYWSWSGQGNWNEWIRWERLGKAIR
ncbi:MAG: signal peptidase I [Nitrospiraceae bacterium]